MIFKEDAKNEVSCVTARLKHSDSEYFLEGTDTPTITLLTLTCDSHMTGTHRTAHYPGVFSLHFLLIYFFFSIVLSHVTSQGLRDNSRALAVPGS